MSSLHYRTRGSCRTILTGSPCSLRYYRCRDVAVHTQHAPLLHVQVEHEHDVDAGDDLHDGHAGAGRASLGPFGLGLSGVGRGVLHFHHVRLDVTCELSFLVSLSLTVLDC